MIEQAVILAAGHGTRLGTLIKDRPKAMLPVLGRPIVVRIMERMYDAGIRNFIVVVGEHEGEVASYLNRSWVPDAKVKIVLQPYSRGPVDSLLQASSTLTGDFLFAPCDVFIPHSHIPALIKRFHDVKPDIALSLIAGSSDIDSAPVFNVKVEGVRVTDVSRTPARRGQQGLFFLYAMSKRILTYAEALRSDADMVGLLQQVLKTGGKLSGVAAEWYTPLADEIDLLTINKRMLREGRDTHILSELPGTVHITPPVRIDPKVSIGQGAKIGPNVYLESGASVGQDAVVWDSLVLRQAAIPDNEVAHGQIIARRARISENSTTEIE
jgi:NDP-sugar pyrophosphorylase family protein